MHGLDKPGVFTTVSKLSDISYVNTLKILPLSSLQRMRVPPQCANQPLNDCRRYQNGLSGATACSPNMTFRM
jgi:hypothetical protein